MLHHMHAMSMPGAAVPAVGYLPRQKKAGLLLVQHRDAANLPHLPCFIPLLYSLERGEVPSLEKHLEGQMHGI